MIIKLNGGRSERRVKLNSNNNCGFIRTAPSYHEYKKYYNIKEQLDRKRLQMVGTGKTNGHY